MKIVADTHTLFWYFRIHQKLSSAAKQFLLAADKIFIPTIVILELSYLMNKMKLKDEFLSILREIEINERYVIISLDIGIVKVMIALTGTLEIHDKIIVATATLFNSPLVTKDPQIQKVYKNTIW